MDDDERGEGLCRGLIWDVHSDAPGRFCRRASLLLHGPGAAARLIGVIGQEAKRFAAKPHYEQVVEVIEVGQPRIARKKTTENRAGKYERGAGYRYPKSVYTEDWFDSSTERDAANLLQDSDEIEVFLRLQR